MTTIGSEPLDYRLDFLLYLPQFSNHFGDRNFGFFLEKSGSIDNTNQLVNGVKTLTVASNSVLFLFPGSLDESDAFKTKSARPDTIWIYLAKTNYVNVAQLFVFQEEIVNRQRIAD